MKREGTTGPLGDAAGRFLYANGLGLYAVGAEGSAFEALFESLPHAV